MALFRDTSHGFDDGATGAPATARYLPRGAGPYWARRLRRLAGTALDAVLPPLCLACGEAVDTHGAVCGACWAEISFIAAPFCTVCGVPFEFDEGPDARCGACLQSPPAFDRARAVMRYGEVSRRLVVGFKHGDRTHGAPAFGRWLARAGVELAAEADIVAPVPLHWRRLAQRRFNQSAMLAGAFVSALPRDATPRYLPDLLVRRRPTPTQGGLGAAARRRNVRGAFIVRDGARDLVAGKRVLLVDDVLTTGATAGECARVLRAGGAVAVDLVTLARVDRPGS